MEYICRVHGNNRLFLTPDHPDYPEFLYWFHWVNGTWQPALGRPLFLQAAGGLSAEHPLAKVTEERLQRSLAALDARLTRSEWLGGREFTAADIMAVFSLTTYRYFYGYSLAGREGILGYLQRIKGREAYRRAMERGDPGMELVMGAEPPEKGITA